MASNYSLASLKMPMDDSTWRFHIGHQDCLKKSETEHTKVRRRKKKKMVELKNKDSSHWWWLDSHSKGSSNRSPWLQSTLADLDEKTRKMLKLIDEDADSFAQRAEMYYRKRPELVSMVEDLYRAHRSLAERHEQHSKSESGLARFPTPWAPQSFSPLSFSKYRLEKSPSLSDDMAYDSYSEACGPDFLDESEVDDPEVEDEEILENKSENEDFDKIKIERLMEEVERLREENRAQKDRLVEKDEEKREAIRQLSLAVDLLRDENMKLRERLVAKKKTTTPKKESEEGFFGRFFGGLSGKLLLPAATTNLVAV
ncbi:kinase interacting family protein [Striga asiatica]|uniref:Kinase interacting family protein n=1 Tax=Striga asiatica TaxID=4170 RepID=A0A5A7P1I8_STRAF|nr:kinase interacting family protein [Striga asiatica]